MAHPFPIFLLFYTKRFFPNIRISYMQDRPLQYFVIRSPYAQLLLTGVKTFEFRSNAKIFANKRLSISVSKTPGAEMMFEQEFKYWEKQQNKPHNDPKYIFNLLLRIITVSLDTMKIVKNLHKLKF